ncbi:MAG: M20/M25/M40 family metallo-hydrolase [Pseudomonadota bacterium]|nr:M20/M25/M40 family metallo-hydrolase [Pseudomonadota bacterium]
MRSHAAAIGLAAGLIVLTALATEQNEPSAINRIVDEGFDRSQLPQIAAHLTDRIGGRMTNSPQMREAEKWTQEQFRAWGLTNVHLEGFEFGRGWSIEKSSVRMISPRTKVLRSIPIAWTPPTNGALTAPVVLAPMRRERDFAKWKGVLRGKIVLVSKPERSSEPYQPSFERLTDESLSELSEYQQPRHSEVEIARTLKEAQFDDRLDAFLAEEGALAWVRMSYRDAGLVTGEGYGHRVGLTPKLPGIELAAEDYRQLARLSRTDASPTIEVISDVRYHDEDTKAYNVIADIPGHDPKAGYVMAGAHLDSWVAADGAGDNAAGSAVIMEAARILSTLSMRPKRTIRFALWSGEEQVLGGSLAYIEKHLATRAPSTDPVANGLHHYYGWRNRWPITPSPGYYDLAAYFNVDNGSGKIRGIYAEGNPAVVPIFRKWFEPFASMGATTISSQRTGATDHELMQAVGIPAFQFIQDPLDYAARIHHSSVDSYDHLQIEDLKQAAVILASFMLNAANLEESLPRMPLPTKPSVTDPFAYEDPDEEDETGE